MAEESPAHSARHDWRVRRQLFLSETIGTAVLVCAGLSLVILINGEGSPMLRLLPDTVARLALTGFLFGTVGGSIALSPVGKVSGAHINPAVTAGFWLMRKLEARAAVGYIVAQLIGGCVGALPLLLWGAMGRSVAFGATFPGPGYSTAAVVLGEAATTFGLIATLCVFLGFRSLRRFTPYTMPVLFGIMVPLEAPVSGTSTNPARSLGPALIAGRWEGWWIYWVGPLIGVIAGIVVCAFFARRIEVAKLYHFEHDRRRLFHRMAGSA
jgi:aquaporin Z